MTRLFDTPTAKACGILPSSPRPSRVFMELLVRRFCRISCPFVQDKRSAIHRSPSNEHRHYNDAPF